jgi:hypothetical protein
MPAGNDDVLRTKRTTLTVSKVLAISGTTGNSHAHIDHGDELCRIKGMTLLWIQSMRHGSDSILPKHVECGRGDLVEGLYLR